jgi:Domain of unknown function (DUF4124)
MQLLLTTLFFLVSITLSLPLLSAAGEVYIWTDESGHKHFSDLPPADGSVTPKIKKEIELHNIDAGYPAGIVVDPTRQRRQGAAAVQNAAAAKRVDQECSRAKFDLRKLSGRVVFHDDQGNQIKVSERERIQMEKSLRADINTNCR